MKPLIFSYVHNGNTYYAEGYDENVIREALEKKLGLNENTLKRGRKPNFETELKRIWDKKDKEFFLSLTKEQTTNQEEIENNRRRQHCLYELDLLLKEDQNFLSGINDLVLIDQTNNVELYYNTGHIMSYRNSKKDNNIIFRFKQMSDAYWHVRKNIIDLDLQDIKYKKTEVTNLEMCDSFIAGFGNSTQPIDINNKSTRELPIGFLHK